MDARKRSDEHLDVILRLSKYTEALEVYIRSISTLVDNKRSKTFTECYQRVYIPAMKSYTVYMLKCSDNSYYVGMTNDITGRLYEHHIGKYPKAYTYKRRPLKVVFLEHFRDVNDAIAFEKQLKGWRREKKEALIRREWNKLPELSKAYRDK